MPPEQAAAVELDVPDIDMDAALAELDKAFETPAPEATNEAVVDKPTVPVVTTPAPAADPPTDDPTLVDGKSGKPVDVAKAPTTWKPEAAKEWEKLPPSVQAEIHRREQDVLNGMRENAETSRFGKEMIRAIEPFREILRENNINIPAQVNGLMSSHYTLAYGTDAQKVDLFSRFAAEYKVPKADLLRAFGVPAPGAGDPAPAAAQSPEVTALLSRIAVLESSVNGVTRQTQERVRAETAATVEAFWADHPYADEVADEVAQLLSTRMAGTLQEAYDKAIYLNPTVREKVLSKQREDADTAAKATAETARLEKLKHARESRAATSVNVRASSRPAGATTDSNGSIEDTLTETYNAIRAREG